MSEDKDRRRRLLRYGELVTRKARSEAKAEEIAEMEEIQRELNLSADEIISEVQHTVEKNY